jgi:hypothetical protein
VTGRPNTVDLRHWIGLRSFQVYQPLLYTFRLNYAESAPLYEAIAAETIRMSLAAAESVTSIRPVVQLPKSKAWAVVQWYYAAFYAAHAIMRMSGHALIQLETGHASDISAVAGLFGMPSQVTAGFHSLSVDATLRHVEFSKMTGEGGSHEFLWSVFERWLADSSAALLSTPGAARDLQDVANRLDDLRSILNSPQAKRGAWLSYVRNRVNYRHEFSTWFPYDGHDDADLCVFSSADLLCENTDTLTLPRRGTVRPIVLFLAATQFLVTLCHDLAVEMQLRAPRRDSFHNFGMLHLRRLVDQPRGRTSR